MNTSKQVNVMIGLMFVFVAAVLLYFLWDQVRADEALDKQHLENAERGGELFALNCRSCHGVNGQGPLENPNLPGAPLNVEANRPEMPGELVARQDRLLNTIRCGRVGTLMPAWAADQGGSLNDFQIEQLVALISGALPNLDPPENPSAVSEEGWEAAVEAAEHADLLEGKKLAEAVSESDTTFLLTDASGLSGGGLLRVDEEVVRIVEAPSASTLTEPVEPDDTELAVERAARLFEEGDVVQAGDELMRVVSVSEDTLEVERGIDGTDATDHPADLQLFEPKDDIDVERGAFATEAAAHEEGAQILNGPIEPPEEPLTGEDGTPPCGQLPPAPSAGGGAEPIPIASGDTLEMGDNFFQFQGQQNPALEISAGEEITLELVNNGMAVHNMHSAGPDNEYGADFCETDGEEPCSDPDTMPGGTTATITFSFDETGTFNFRCDFHPVQMVGTIVVTEQ